eukprot:TRINITY_DN2394_c0_g3_i2.p1 TRINITY_DN2394_c0_g3~~TRINITY_DN2394_c0_g3_i2.p1  ORF type:complete len:427 (-),score=138.98 TRINITY_DN2394_c0_g3_i2:181-1461(-)
MTSLQFAQKHQQAHHLSIPHHHLQQQHQLQLQQQLQQHHHFNRHHQSEMFREKSQPYPKPSLSAHSLLDAPNDSAAGGGCGVGAEAMVLMMSSVVDFSPSPMSLSLSPPSSPPSSPLPPQLNNTIQLKAEERKAGKRNDHHDIVPDHTHAHPLRQVSVPLNVPSSTSPAPSPSGSPSSSAKFDDLNLENFDDSDELMLKSTDPTLDLASATFHHEMMFNKSMTIVCLELGKFLVGREVATLLKRQTFNMYRSMKLRGIGILRAIPDHLDFFSQLGVVKVGTHSLTLVPYEDGKKFIRDCKLREARLEKRKKKTATQQQPPQPQQPQQPTQQQTPQQPPQPPQPQPQPQPPVQQPTVPVTRSMRMANSSLSSSSVNLLASCINTINSSSAHANDAASGNGSPRQKASLFDLYLVANEMMSENNDATF